MSEENLKKAVASGSAASGGVGGVTDPAIGVLGNIEPGTEFGLDTGPNAVQPVGAPGGILAPEQSQRFIDYVWDATVLAKEGRKITMKANTIELDKVNVGERVIRAAAQADDAYTNTGAKFSKIDLTTTKIRLDWEVATEALEDNIEGAGLEDHLVQLMTNALANDIEDLAINGDGSTAGFLAILQGFSNQVQTDGFAHEFDTTITANAWTPVDMQGLISALPRKYRALKSGLKFYAGTDTFAGIVENNGTIASAVSTENYRNSYLDGKDQVLGDARTTRALGVPVLEVPYFPDDYVELTFPANRVWGFQRNIKVNREYRAKKDTIEYTVYLRFGIAWEEQDAVAFADAAADI